jgi:hypothetical protein
MARSIVTSENKSEFDEAKLSPSVKRAYSTDLKVADEASSKIKDDAKSHRDAMMAHKQASIYAYPPENIEKHLEKARYHAAEHRKFTKLEGERYVKANLESGKAKHAEFMRKGDEKRRKAKTL